METVEGPQLTMEYHRKSDRYQIKEKTGRYVAFPSRPLVEGIWKEVFPDTYFWIGSSIIDPVPYFYADVGPGTRPKDREKFCEALAKKCTFAE